MTGTTEHISASAGPHVRNPLKTIAVLTLAAGLSLAASPAFATGNHTCTVTIVHVPAVTHTVTVPAKYGPTEYQFAFKKDHPNSPRWETNPDWNADSNPNSTGWHSTGITRPGQLLAPAHTETIVDVPAFDKPIEACLPPVVTPPVEDCPPVVIPPVVVTPPVDVPPVDVPPAVIPPAVVPPVVAPPPAAVLPPAAVPAAVAAPTPALAARVVSTPAATPASAAPAAELAYTGSADWVLPAGLGILAAGAALIMIGKRKWIS